MKLVILVFGLGVTGGGKRLLFLFAKGDDDGSGFIARQGGMRYPPAGDEKGRAADVQRWVLPAAT